MCRFLTLSLRRRRAETPLQRIERAVSRLDRKTRAIFFAHRLDGLSYREIAERTGLSMTEVERRIPKAARRLLDAKLRD